MKSIDYYKGILPNKYKSNLRSISQTSTHYWMCGDDSTLLKVRKHDFVIEKISLDTFCDNQNIDHIDFLKVDTDGKINLHNFFNFDCLFFVNFIKIEFFVKISEFENFENLQNFNMNIVLEEMKIFGYDLKNLQTKKNLFDCFFNYSNQ